MSENRKVVVLYKDSPTDIPSLLRTLADDVENGTHGDVPRAVVVLEANEGVETFGFGPGCDQRSVVYLLQAGVVSTVMSRVEG